jgi:hypothetical protein
MLWISCYAAAGDSPIKALADEVDDELEKLLPALIRAGYVG